MADDNVFQSISAKEVRTTILKGGADLGITADAGSVQGGYPLTSSFNVIDTSGTAGNAVTLPSEFSAGTLIFIKNGAAANSVDVFPALGDDLGGGANAAAALAAGAGILYIATVADATWESLIP